PGPPRGPITSQRDDGSWRCLRRWVGSGLLQGHRRPADAMDCWHELESKSGCRRSRASVPVMEKVCNSFFRLAGLGRLLFGNIGPKKINIRPHFAWIVVPLYAFVINNLARPAW